MTQSDGIGRGGRKKHRAVPPLDGFANGPGLAPRRCDHAGCGAEGLYRAPKDRGLREYYWFCLVHVQDYNRTWNYYGAMSEAEIEREIRYSTVWNRPTWPLGERAVNARPGTESPFADPFGLFEEQNGEAARARVSREGARHREDGPRARAMRVLDLEEPLTLDGLKSRYKVLVKRHHPDANGGDKDSEERFKMVNEAYHVLVNVLNA
ncbi:J domain-containing protein [Rhodospirillum rubrum]|nr:J domain-containing protein [Rhodospirillum rubrum]